MDSWLGTHIYPKLIAFALLLTGVIPGLIFLAWSKDKLSCPSCGLVK